VFSHGQFINAVAWLVECTPQKIDGLAMAEWREYEITNHVPNCSGYTLSKSSDDADWTLSSEASRIDVDKHVPGRTYQVIRDPERRPIEERAQALSAAGCPLSDDDSAMYAEHLLRAAKETAPPSEVRDIDENIPLLAREVCQILREVTFERRTMTKVSQASWDEIYAGHFVVSVEGWRISIYNDCDTLDYCEECVSPERRRWSFDAGDRFGTDPIALLSTWEHQTLERLLKAL